MPTPSAQPKSARELAKAQSRARLVEATAEAIYRHGIRGTTIGEIQAISGLSRGMITLHFKGKENLLLAVAQQLCDTYDTHMEHAMTAAGNDPEARLLALFHADLDPVILNERDVSIWFSFRAEVHANPTFRPLISTRSGSFSGLLSGLSAELLGQSYSPPNAPHLAGSALISLLEGIWTDFHLNPSAFDREEAFETCLYTARALFPGRFADGAG